MFGTALALKMKPQRENIMEYTLIRQTTNLMVDRNLQAFNDIEEALKQNNKFIVLDFDKDFVYNSTIISLALLNKDRVIIIENENERLKVMTKILKIDKMLCMVKTLEQFIDRCANTNAKHCKDCAKNIQNG